MKKHIKLIVLSFGLVSALFSSCNFGAAGSWANDNIDKEIKADISELNKKLFEKLVAKDMDGAKQLMASDLLKTAGKGIDTAIMAIRSRVNTTSFTIIDEYYTKNTATNINNTLLSTHGNDNDYIINYLALNKEMYVSLLIPAETDINFLILIVYGKYDTGWKINIIKAGEYSYFGKTAPDLYNQALKLQKQNNTIDAALAMVNASQIARPAADYLSYKKDKEMKTFFDDIIKQANTQYHFPITVDEIKTKPQIFSVTPQYISDKDKAGIYPMVAYVSDIKLTDTVALKTENDAMQKVIGKLFNGIENNNTYLVYKATNQIPDGKTLVNHYGFIQKLK